MIPNAHGKGSVPDRIGLPKKATGISRPPVRIAIPAKIHPVYIGYCGGAINQRSQEQWSRRKLVSTSSLWTTIRNRHDDTVVNIHQNQK